MEFKKNNKSSKNKIKTKYKFKPNWNACFDCHLYEGRMINIIVKNKNDEIGETTISAEYLANRSKDKVLNYDWVSESIFPIY